MNSSRKPEGESSQVAFVDQGRGRMALHLALESFVRQFERFDRRRRRLR